MRFFRVQREGLERAAFDGLRRALLESSFVSASTLNGPFEASRGFGVTFTEAGRAQLIQRFPPLEPWLARALGAPAIRALTPWWRRTLTRLPNAWYLNVLVVGPGAEVARHIDGTLMQPAGVADHPPECVSVLYLDVPRTRGGELALWNGAVPVGLVTPRVGQAVHFRGDLAHAVRPFEGAPELRRASLVIEQYHFGEEALARLPAFKLDSRAGFGAYLDDHARRPPTVFTLDG
ncbi:MAG: 2OG-Fe(II) oxygenase [Myxococcaceae bacterium]|nr:2OG-Fe(II) oxygenase [Myxococcaceae bacterium]